MRLGEWLFKKKYLNLYYYYSVLRMWRDKSIAYVKYYINKLNQLKNK